MSKFIVNTFMQEWTVSLNGGFVDTVFFDKHLQEDYVLDCLINHDNYNYNIKVTKAGK
jgi:hypothetical protein